jgi:hypothetical protein
MPATTTVAVLVGEGEMPFERPIWGSIVRTGLLWKNATLSLATTRGLVVVEGMPSIVAALQAEAPDARIRIALPIHEGYLALYGPDGRVAARILENDAGLGVRIMDPHVAYAAHGPLGHVVEGVFRQLENQREQRA